MPFIVSTKRTITMFQYRISIIGKVFFLLFILWACGTSHTPVEVDGRLVAIDSLTIPEKDKQVDSVIAIYRVAMEEEMNQVLAHSAHVMQRGSPEGLLNNFVADLIMETGQQLYTPVDGKHIDFTLLNYGGLRTSIPEGPVTRARIFELMPFENEMVVLTLTPGNTLRAFEYLAASERGMPVSGIRLHVTNNSVKEVLIQGAPFDASRNYKVLTSDYLAGGGDNMIFFLNPDNEEFLGKRIRDAIIDYLVKQNHLGREIESKLDGRIKTE